MEIGESIQVDTTYTKNRKTPDEARALMGCISIGIRNERGFDMNQIAITPPGAVIKKDFHQVPSITDRTILGVHRSEIQNAKKVMPMTMGTPITRLPTTRLPGDNRSLPKNECATAIAKADVTRTTRPSAVQPWNSSTILSECPVAKNQPNIFNSVPTAKIGVSSNPNHTNRHRSSCS